MLRTHIYLPETLDAEIEHMARTTRRNKAEVIREAIKHGLRVLRPKKSPSAKALLDLAKAAEKLYKKGERLPADLAKNHDKYTWE